MSNTATGMVNKSQIQQASKINSLHLPPINKKANQSTHVHPKVWNANKSQKRDVARVTPA